MSAAQRTPLLAVKSKEGELQALLNTTEVNDRVQVMVELLDSVDSGGLVIKKVVDFCVESASRGRPVWVDTTWLTRASDLGASPRAVLERLEHEIEESLGLFSICSEQPCLIPVVPLNTDDEGLRAIRMFLEHRRRPVVVRCRQTSLPTTELLRTLDRIATALRLGTDELHLVFDEGYVRKLETHRVDALVDNITGLANRNEYASVAVLAGSTPRKRSYGTHLRRRAEVELWKTVQEASGERIRYGDYGVVHPDPQKSSKEGGYPTLTSITPFRERRCTSPARTQSAKGTRYHRDPPNGTSSKSPTNSCIGPNSPVPTSRGVTETSTLAANDRTHRWAAHRGGSRSPPRTMWCMCRDLWTHREREDADRTAPGVTRPFPNQRIFGRCEPSSSSERTMSERRPLRRDRMATADIQPGEVGTSQPLARFVFPRNHRSDVADSAIVSAQR